MQSGNHFKYLPGSASSQEHGTVSVLMAQGSLLCHTSVSYAQSRKTKSVSLEKSACTSHTEGDQYST